MGLIVITMKHPGHYTKEEKREAEAMGITLKYYADRDITVGCEKIVKCTKQPTEAQNAHRKLMKEAITEAKRLKAIGKLPHFEDRTKKSDFHEFVSRYINGTLK